MDTVVDGLKCTFGFMPPTGPKQDKGKQVLVNTMSALAGTFLAVCAARSRMGYAATLAIGSSLSVIDLVDNIVDRIPPYEAHCKGHHLHEMNLKPMLRIASWGLALAAGIQGRILFLKGLPAFLPLIAVTVNGYRRLPD